LHSIWGIAGGSHDINVDQEIIAYAVLDILAKPIFSAWLLFLPDTNIGLGGFCSEGFRRQRAIRVGDDDEGA
jgi:bacteriorhodopsin